MVTRAAHDAARMSDAALRFPSPHSHPFPDALKHEVGAWFADNARSPHADAKMWTKAAVLLSGTVVTWIVLVFVPLPGLVALALAGVLGVFIAAVGMAVGHDALHGSMSARPWVNRLLGLSFDLIGANSYIWRFTHNRNHHLYTNLEGVDLDLDLAPLLAVTPGVPRRAAHRWQHLYALGVYALTTLHWLLLKDFLYFSMRRLGALRAVHHPWWAWTWLVVGKLFAWSTHLAIPLLLAPYAWWQVLLGFGVAHLVGGLLMATVFQLAHQVSPTDFPEADAHGTLPFPFLIHQLRTTANFACENRPLSWLVGGLNFQVEHHLFPNICSVHYPALRPIVRAVAARHDVPYHEYPTVSAALADHLGWLRAQGAKAAPT